MGDLSGNITGNLSGDVTGYVTGDVNGNLTGDLNKAVTVFNNLSGNDISGNVIYASSKFVGDLSGNITGNLSGDVTGYVTGDVNGNLTGDLNKAVTVFNNLSGNDISGNVIYASSKFVGDLSGNVTGNLDGVIGGNTPAEVMGTTITADTIKIGSNYTLPKTDGDENRFLKTDGNGNITWDLDQNLYTKNSELSAEVSLLNEKVALLETYAIMLERQIANTNRVQYVYVGDGNLSQWPWYRFYTDPEGSNEMDKDDNGYTILYLDTKYIFYRLDGHTQHPFYVSDVGWTKPSTSAITISGNGKSTDGIVGDSTFTLVFNNLQITDSFYYFCTDHSSDLSTFTLKETKDS